MMLYKLSLRNIRKSIKDYTIYFFTLILGIAIFYIFNALDSQTAMMKVSEGTQNIIELMMELLSGVSVFVSFILGFLILYASRFLIKRRNKEFGLYFLLGMSKRKISKLLFLETLCIGFISLIVGLIIGIALSQVMSLFVVNMFEADLTSFSFTFSMSACIKTIIYFSIMYLLVILFHTYSINKCKLIDLFNNIKKSEELKLKNTWLCTIVFIISAAVLGKAYAMVQVDIEIIENLFIPITMGAVSTFFIFWSLSGFILKVAKSRKRFYYKKLNSFVLRQFSSKINTTVFSTTTICLMLFLTICLLSSCLTMKNTMNANLRELAPADILFKTTAWEAPSDGNAPMEILREVDFDMAAYLKEYVEVSVYQKEEVKSGNTVSSVSHMLKDYIYRSMLHISQDMMKVSDYNKVAKMYGKEEYTLADDEYIMLANVENMVEIRNAALQRGQEINLFGQTLKPKYDTCQNGFLELSNNPINMGILLVPDIVLEGQYGEVNYLIGNYKEMSKEER
ncbi:MAG: ABC transporter permease, partial [Erysipelotrichaceae bacterium]|nr:ABC transporter permease [Erysipelotrichaceae bacterium]